MNILVTGASGFIGRNFLLSCPSSWQVLALYRSAADFPEWLRQQGLAHVTPLKLDLESPDEVQCLAEKHPHFDSCLYLAANGDPAHSDHHPRFDLCANTVALVTLLEKIRTDRLLYFSSGAVYDRLCGNVSPRSPIAPVLPYAISKLACERYIQHFQEKGHLGTATVIRFFGAYGPYEAPRKIYGRLVRQFAKDRDPVFTIRGNGQNLIDAMYVDDALQAVHRLLLHPTLPPVLDLATGNPYTLLSLVETAARTFGIEPQIRCVGTVPECIHFRSEDTTMKDLLDFSPSTPLPDGLRRFHDFLASHA